MSHEIKKIKKEEKRKRRNLILGGIVLLILFLGGLGALLYISVADRVAAPTPLPTQEPASQQVIEAIREQRATPAPALTEELNADPSPTPEVNLGPVAPPSGRLGLQEEFQPGEEATLNFPGVTFFVTLDGLGPRGARFRGTPGILEAGDPLIREVDGGVIWWGSLIEIDLGRRVAVVYLFDQVVFIPEAEINES